MTISVVVPVYNAAEFVERALQSAFNQSVQPLEVIVVDDASTDETAPLILRLAQAEPRIRLVKLPRNGGPSAARNAGFAAAIGDWIAILDADDAYEPRRLEKLQGVAVRHQADMAADNIIFYDKVAGKSAGHGVTTITSEIQISRHLFVENSQSNLEDIDFGLLKPIFRRTFLQSKGLRYRDEVRHGEDFIFYLDCLLADAKWVFTPEAGYLYTERWGSLSGAASGMSRTRIDYFGIAAETRRLLADTRVRGDRRLACLLEKRRRRLHTMAIQRRMSAVTRNVRILASALRRSPGDLPSLVRNAIRKALARFARP